MKRTELRRTPLKAKRTKTTRARPDEPLAVWCEVAVPGICTGRAAQRHHILRRAQGGGDEASNTVDLCTCCHVHIHAHIEWAKAHGWLKHAPTQEIA